MADAQGRPTLELAGNLAILAGDHALGIEFRDEVVLLDLADLGSARALSRLVKRVDRRVRLAQLQAVLDRAGLLLTVRIAGREVARLGGGLRPGRLAAWLGIDPMRLDAREILRLLARGPASTR